MLWLNLFSLPDRLKDIDCILALETAAEYVGISNGGYSNKITIYTKKEIDIDGLECLITDDYDNIEHIVINGLKCTTKERTIRDLLKYDRSLETTLSSLSNYYFDNGESFDELISYLDGDIIEVFNKYKEDAIQYYSE